MDSASPQPTSTDYTPEMLRRLHLIRDRRAEVDDRLDAIEDRLSETTADFDYHYDGGGGLDSGFLLTCGDIAEFIATVALGPRYTELLGTSNVESWWRTDAWYLYLTELDLIAS